MESNYKGFSLIEVVLSIGILSVVLLASHTLVLNFLKATSRLDSRIEAINMAGQIDRLLTSGHNCTVSLKGITLHPSSLSQINSLYYAMEDSSNPGSYIRAKSPAFVISENHLQRVNIKSFDILLVQEISQNPKQYLAEIKSSVVDKSQNLINTPPSMVMLTTDSSNVVEYCSNVFSNKSSFKERLCEITSDGFKMYDHSTGKCIDKFEPQWVEGENRFASCPIGYKKVPGRLSFDLWDDSSSRFY